MFYSHNVTLVTGMHGWNSVGAAFFFSLLLAAWTIIVDVPLLFVSLKSIVCSGNGDDDDDAGRFRSVDQ